MKQSFKVTLQSMNFMMPITIVPIPFDVEKTFGTKNRLDVKGTIDGLPIQRTLLSSGDGTHYLMLNAAMRKAIGKGEGDEVFVEIEPDNTYKIVEMPDYFLMELEENEVAKIEFKRTSPSNKRWMQQFLTEGKSMETKANRVLKVLDMLIRNSKRRKKVKSEK
jgi:Domain of unknown function (DUF1905)/Bacteriocin-protection, YdeI or OmpD-Associated